MRIKPKSVDAKAAKKGKQGRKDERELGVVHGALCELKRKSVDAKAAKKGKQGRKEEPELTAVHGARFR